MTAHQLKVHVSDPANQYRRLDPVTLIPVPVPTGRGWDVYHGGELVGTILRRQHSPSVKIPGTRTRKNLAPRAVWDAYTLAPRRDLLVARTRNDALFHLIGKRTP